MTDTLSPEPPRDEIEDLLPWYANGRLGSRDRARVEAALMVDDDLARRLGLIREEMAASVAANEAIETPSAAIFDRILTGMDAAPTSSPTTETAATPSGREAVPPVVETIEVAPATPKPSTAVPERAGGRAAETMKRAAAIRAGWLRRLTDFVAMVDPRTLAFAGLAAAVIVVVQGATLAGLLLERSAGPTYQTASRASAPTSGPVVLVAFTPEAKIADVAAFLKRHDAQVIDGPRANGFFKLRIGGTGTDAAAIAEIMRRESALVSFAQPSS